jgi:pimeloyl-ACP methyl ester carboxylesterase
MLERLFSGPLQPSPTKDSKPTVDLARVLDLRDLLFMQASRPNAVLWKCRNQHFAQSSLLLDSNRPPMTLTKISSQAVPWSRDMQYCSLSVSLSDQLLLHLREWGSGPLSCFLIHGFGEGSHVWTDFAPPLASACRTLAVDLRGHGDSSWDPDCDYSIRKHVADVSHAISSLGLDRIVLVGHSMGGDIAIRLAAEIGRRVAALIVVDFGPRIDPAAAAKIHADFNEGTKTYASVAEYASFLAATRPLASSEVLQRVASSALLETGNGSFRLRCDPKMGEGSVSSANRDAREAESWLLLKKVKCPVLVVRGRGSSVLSQAVAEQMVHSLRDGRLALVECAGHAVMLDNPKGFETVALSFLTGILNRGAHIV